jgi:formylglycine-generating enzyme required for sulfatase activity
VIVSLAAYETRPKWAISYSWCSIVMQNSRQIAGFTGRVRRYLHAFGYVLIVTLMGASFLRTATAATNDMQGRVEDIAALASSALMLTVAEGPFIMGTARTSHEPFSFDLQYDDTEQPQRRVWLHQ